MNYIAKIGLLLSIGSLSPLYAQKQYSLQECIDYAMTHNISIQNAGIQSKIAENNIKMSKGNRLPSVNSNLSQSANFYMSDNASTNGNFTTRLDAISANWTVFDGFQNLKNYQKSLIDKDIADKNTEVLKNDISLNIANAYLQVLFNKELVKVSENQLDLSNKQLKIVQTQFKAGSVPQANIVDAEATVAQDELTLTQRKNSVSSSLLNLKQLMQIPAEETFDVQPIDADNYMNRLAVKTPAEIYEIAVAQRAEIQLAELNIKSAEKSIEIAKAAKLPTVSLGYNFGTVYNKVNGGYNSAFTDQVWDNLGHQLSATLSIPIFNGWKNETNYKNAQLNQEKYNFDLQNQKYTLRQNIEMAYLEAINAKKTYEASQKSMTSRALALDYTQKRYEIGNVNLFDFETARNNWISAQGTLAQAKYDFLFKVKVLQFYAGWSLGEEL